MLLESFHPLKTKQGSLQRKLTSSRDYIYRDLPTVGYISNYGPSQGSHLTASVECECMTGLTFNCNRNPSSTMNSRVTHHAVFLYKCCHAPFYPLRIPMQARQSWYHKASRQASKLAGRHVGRSHAADT